MDPSHFLHHCDACWLADVQRDEWSFMYLSCDFPHTDAVAWRSIRQLYPDPGHARSVSIAMTLACASRMMVDHCHDESLRHREKGEKHKLPGTTSARTPRTIY